LVRAAQPRFSAHAASSIVALLLITVQVASKIARDTLFMSQSTARELSVAMVCSGALSVACAFYASARGRAAKPGASLAVTLSLSASCFLLEGLLVPHAPKAAACIAFGHIGALGPLAVSYLWMGFAERFRGRAAEGAFVSISSAATLGGVFGGVLAERVTRTFSMPTLLFGLAALSLALAAWGLVAARHQPQEPALGSAVPPPPPSK
jgi:MFS family permease